MCWSSWADHVGADPLQLLLLKAPSGKRNSISRWVFPTKTRFLGFIFPHSVGLFISALVWEPPLLGSSLIQWILGGFYFFFSPPQGQKASHAEGKNRNLISELVRVSSRWEITSAILYLGKGLSVLAPTRISGEGRPGSRARPQGCICWLAVVCLFVTSSFGEFPLCARRRRLDANRLIAGSGFLQRCQKQSPGKFPAGLRNHECTFPVRRESDVIVLICVFCDSSRHWKQLWFRCLRW